MTHTVTVAPSAAKIVDADGKLSELPKQRTPTHRARCTCGWRGAEYATEEQAWTQGRAHERMMVKR